MKTSEITRYSDLLFSLMDDNDEIVLTPLEERLHRIAKEAIPTSIDRTDDGEFVIRESYPDLYARTEDGGISYNPEFISSVSITKDGHFNLSDKKTREALGYFLNEDCSLDFYVREGEIKAFYKGDGDGEYHFDINVNDEMSDDEIKKALIVGFSNKFGWVELFEDDHSKLKGVDTKFWAAVTYKGERKLIEVGREAFNLCVDVFDENGEWDAERYDESSEAFAKVIEKHFDIKSEDMILEFYNLSEQDMQDCAFESIEVIDINE
ncbi:MAG: hypothetical protein AABY15_06480 [Nanoarchaeota archaeon]